MRKKHLGFSLLVICLCLCLVGCSDREKEEAWVVPANYDGVQSETGYFYPKEGFLYYTDFSSGISVCLCSRAGCQHDNQDLCDSWIGSHVEMFFWEDKLYYLKSTAYGPCLYRRDQDGGGLTTVATLCETYLEEENGISIQIGKQAVTGGYLYYTADVQAVRFVGDRSELVTLYSLIQQIDLKSGKEKTILKDELGVNLVAAKGDRIRYRTADKMANLDGADHDAICNAYKNTKTRIIERNVATGEETVLLEKTKYDFFSAEIILDDKIIYMSYESDDANNAYYYSYDLRTKETAFYHKGNLVGAFAGRYCLHWDSQRKQTILFDFETGQELPIHSFYGDDATAYITVVNPAGDYVILRRYCRPVSGGGSVGEMVYFYVPISALSDGLQEKDCTDYYVWKK